MSRIDELEAKIAECRAELSAKGILDYASYVELLKISEELVHQIRGLHERVSKVSGRVREVEKRTVKRR